MLKLKLKQLYFDNGLGDVISFTSDSLMYQKNDLMSQKWSYNKTQYADGTYEITNFYKADKSFNLTVHLWYIKSEAEYRAAIDKITQVADKNIMTNSFGKLYVNSEYLMCRITGIEHDDWMTRTYQHKINLTITADNPMWISERTTSLSNAQSISGITYPHSYPTHFGTRTTINQINNLHYANSKFKIIFYGNCSNPVLTIGDVQYGFNRLTLSSTEYAVYDTLNRELYKMSVGVKTDLFNNRVTRSGKAFTPIPPGISPLSWDRSFKADITIYSERSLPAWSVV